MNNCLHKKRTSLVIAVFVLATMVFGAPWTLAQQVDPSLETYSNTAKKKGQRRLVNLRQGEVFEGFLLAEKSKTRRFETAFGTRIVNHKDVVLMRDATKVAGEYAQRYAKLKKKDLKGHLALAQWCLGRGFTSGLEYQLNKLLRLEPHHAPSLAIIKRLAQSDAYRLAKKNPQPRDKSRWKRSEVDLLYGAAKKADFAQTALIRMQLDALPKDIQLNAAIKHAKKGSETQRWLAVYQLGRSDKVRRVKPLYKRALGDDSWQVRSEAVASLKAHDDGTTAGPFLKVLLTSEVPLARVYAAEALGLLGDTRAIAPMISALAAAGSGRPARNNITSTRQVAYVKDYDVEVAQSAVIADPIVDVIQDGVVLDVAVVSIQTQRKVISRGLGRLTGKSLGMNAAAWQKWWKAQKK